MEGRATPLWDDKIGLHFFWGSKFVNFVNGTIPMEEDMVSFIFLTFFVHVGLHERFLDDDVEQRDLT
jgi:hypothetical protein